MTLQPSDVRSCQPESNRVEDSKSETFDWLVSVRSLDEAEMAAEHGVDIIDVKEPMNGSLGSASLDVLHSIAEDASLRSRALSVALGDGRDAVSLAPLLPTGFRFAKAGPVGMSSLSALRDFWIELREQLCGKAELVAVSYADSRSADCPSPRMVLELAAELGFSRILIDTFRKESGSSIERLGEVGITEFAELAKATGIWWSLAGSIRLETIARHWNRWSDQDSQPDCLAIRGDACEGSREGQLCPSRLKAWQAFRDSGSGNGVS